MKIVTVMCLVCLCCCIAVGCSLANIGKKPFMCCATKTTFRCTQEIPQGEVAVGEPGEVCAVSTDILKAQGAAQATVAGGGL